MDRNAQHAQDPLMLDNQLCFPLYASSKEIIRHYKPLLDQLDLTYTQYIAMMVLWEEKRVTAKHLGERLYLDSGTLTPLLKKLEAKEYLTRERDRNDERNLVLCLTEKGEALREKAATVPAAISSCVSLTPQEAGTLYHLLYKLLREMTSDR